MKDIFYDLLAIILPNQNRNETLLKIVALRTVVVTQAGRPEESWSRFWAQPPSKIGYLNGVRYRSIDPVISSGWRKKCDYETRCALSKKRGQIEARKIRSCFPRRPL